MKICLGLFFSLAVAVTTSAQQPVLDPSQPLPPRVIDQIIVTASELPETIESTPAAVTVVTRRDIEDRAALDVLEVLREVPGLAVAETGSLGKAASIFTRGSSSKQTLVLWNGMEINDTYFSGYNWGQFSTAGVERIEVARGPFSSLYGADAMGGVINIITTGGRDRADVDVAIGGRGLANGVGSFSRSFGNTSIQATAEHRADNGFAPNDDDRQNSLAGGVLWSPSLQTSLGLNGRYVGYDLGVPRNTNAFATAYVFTPHSRERGNEWQFGIPATFQLGALKAEARVSESRRHDTNEDPDALTFGDTTSTRRNAHVSLQASTAIGTIIGGGEIERAYAENHDSFGLDIDRHHRSSTAIFVEDRITGDVAGGTLESALGLRRDEYETFGSELSPRAAFAFRRSGSKFRLGYGKAFRAPQIGELYLPFFGNPALHAERSRSFEAGYDRYWSANGSFSVTAFHADYRDLINYDLARNTFGNIGRARSRGVEVSAADRRGPFRLSVSYTFLRATEQPSGDQLPRRPRHSGSIALGYEHGAGNAELVVARVGSRPDVNDLFPFTNVVNGSYTVANLTLRWLTGAFSPYLKVENLANRKYQEVFGYPSPTRRALVGVRYNIAR